MDVNDNINMEYEARVMINKEQYLKICNYYLSQGLNYRKIINENYYFDTETLLLTNSHKVLRIRKINEKKHELTLKIQEANVAIEINHILTAIEKEQMLKKGEIVYKQIIDKLLSYNINPSSIKYITNLKTERLEFNLPDCLLVVDKNYYGNKVDYNVEVESDSEINAKTKLLSIISPFGIKYKKDYINKARRAIYNL